MAHRYQPLYSKKRETMSITKLFPITLIILDSLSAIVYGVNGDFRMMIYWIAAAVLTICVTF